MADATVPLRLGHAVPDFELDTYEPAADDFGRFSLAGQVERKRWTILFFYPSDFTSVCASEFAALGERLDRFATLACDIVTVSTNTPQSHRAWRGQEQALAAITCSMGSDTTGAVGRMFGVYDEGSGLNLRGTFILTPDGVLLGTELNFYNLGRNIDELMRKLEANVYLAAKTNESCPSEWRHSGDTTHVNHA